MIMSFVQVAQKQFFPSWRSLDQNDWKKDQIFVYFCMMQHTGSEEGLKYSQSIDQECVDVYHFM